MAEPYTVLARRYRSSTFREVVGQEHVAGTLERAIERGRVAHAFLFTGTRGVGKTSMARILAKALNCLSADAPTTTPCGTCDLCGRVARGEDLDVIEIDAASNTGVDNVRDLIENSRLHPARARYRVYIIDEVHMLSKSAFNALLKVMEEPPPHVKFILATTEVERVPATILSRCQRYDFRNIPTREIAEHLRHVVKSEKVKADDDALLLIARAGAGSMRDALSLLDRVLSLGDDSLDAATAERLLGVPRAQAMAELAEAVGTGDVRAALEKANAQIDAGLSPDALVGGLSDFLHNLLLVRVCGGDSGLVELAGLEEGQAASLAARFEPADLAADIALLEELRRSMRNSQVRRALIDATLTRLALSEQFTPISALMDGGAPAPPKKSAPAKPPPARPSAAPEVAARREEPTPPPSSNVAPVAADDKLAGAWTALMDRLAREAPSLPGMLQGAQLVGLEAGVATLRFAGDAADLGRMFERNGKRDVVQQGLGELLGEPVRLHVAVEEPEAAVVEAKPEAAPAVPKPRLEEVKADDAPQASREDWAKVEAHPLVDALLRHLDGRVVKVEPAD